MAEYVSSYVSHTVILAVIAYITFPLQTSLDKMYERVNKRPAFVTTDNAIGRYQRNLNLLHEKEQFII